MATYCLDCRTTDWPAAVVAQGTLAGQRTVAATLGTLTAEVELEGLSSPCLTIVGEVVRLRETLRWFDSPALQPTEQSVALPLGTAATP